MGHFSATLLLLTMTSQVFTAPQFITFKDGNVGVNFGGYHAAAGLGGLLNGGAAGGLFAEAGTPHGQAARAGLGGAAGGVGTGGSLYADATAGGNVGAAAGLAGGVDAQKSAGVGYAAASAGNRNAAAGLGGESGAHGSSGFTYSSSKSFGVASGSEVAKQPINVNKKVHTEFNFDAPEVPAVALTNTVVKSKTKVKEVSNTRGDLFRSSPRSIFNFQGMFSSLFRIPEAFRQPVFHFPQPSGYFQSQKVHVEQPRVVVEKHVVQPEPVIIEKHIYHPQPVYVEKHIHHKKPHRYHNKVTAYGYIGGAAVPPPAIEKRIDVGVESSANAEAGAAVNGGANKQVTYTKQVNFQRNPQFFADIFNIPISTLKAVGNFLGNTAGSTSVSVQKSASVQAGADSDSISPKHDQSSSSQQAQVSIQTPDASKVINDIFAIPINTLSAVNKFLENNVPARKKVEVSADGVEEPTRFRLGPHARRRATKTVYVEQPPAKSEDEPKESE